MKIKISKSQWEGIGKKAGWTVAMGTLPQDVKMNDAEIVNEVMRLLRQKRSEENIWEYFRIVYPNVKLTQHHIFKARSRMIVFESNEGT